MKFILAHTRRSNASLLPFLASSSSPSPRSSAPRRTIAITPESGTPASDSHHSHRRVSLPSSLQPQEAIPSSLSRASPPPPSSTPSRPRSADGRANPTTSSSASPSPRPSSASSSADPPPPAPSPPPSPADRLLHFSRILPTAPSPTPQDLQTALFLYQQTYPETSSHLTVRPDPARVETVLRFLVYANRAPSSLSFTTHPDGRIVANAISALVATLMADEGMDLVALGIDSKTELLPLVHKSSSPTRVRMLRRVLQQQMGRDFDQEEKEVVERAMSALLFPGRKPESLEDLIDRSRLVLTTTADIDASSRWLKDSSKALATPRSIGQDDAYALLARCPLSSSLSPEALLAAFDLYSIYILPRLISSPSVKQRAEVAVRILLLLANFTHPPSSLPPGLLGPLLRILRTLPRACIPSTPTVPSFIAPLLRLSNRLDLSLAIVDALFHAQAPQPNPVSNFLSSEIWTPFLSSLSRQFTPPPPSAVVDSALFKLVDAANPGQAFDGLLQMYLRRFQRAERTGIASQTEQEGRAMDACETSLEYKRRNMRRKRGEEETWGTVSLFSTVMKVRAARGDWEGVREVWEGVQERQGVDGRGVGVYLLSTLRSTPPAPHLAISLFDTIRANPVMLPLLSGARNWALYYDVLVQATDLAKLVETVEWQVELASKAGKSAGAEGSEGEAEGEGREGDGSKVPVTVILADSDVAKVVRLARKVGGEEGGKAEGRVRELVRGEERWDKVKKALEDEEM